MDITLRLFVVYVTYSVTLVAMGDQSVLVIGALSLLVGTLAGILKADNQHIEIGGILHLETPRCVETRPFPKAA
jgi:hypothetical protein